MHSPRWRSSATTETRSSTTSRDEVDHDDHHFFYHHQKLISGNHGLNTKHQIYSETKININIFISLFAIVLDLKKRNGWQHTIDAATHRYHALTHRHLPIGSEGEKAELMQLKEKVKECLSWSTKDKVHRTLV